MSPQERIRRPKGTEAPQEAQAGTQGARVEHEGRTEDERAERDAELESILDEIDEVLIENAAEFVGAFVQKGGE